jgi:GNAT superfamily N-acetyltransferase
MLNATYGAFRGRVPDRCPDWLTVEESATNWGRNFENDILPPGNHLFVAEVARTDAIGLAMARRRSADTSIDPEIAKGYGQELVTLQVDPAWQRRGVGRELVAVIAKTLLKERESQTRLLRTAWPKTPRFSTL